MADQPSAAESGMDLVLRRLEEIDLRLRAIEVRFDGISRPDAEPAAPASRLGPLPRPSFQKVSGVTIASLTGRTCLVLGGGYLLRALADAGILPLPLAVALGLAYAIGWFLVADRAAQSLRAVSAAFHALAAAGLAFPLWFEIIVRFRMLSDLTGAVGLTVVSALGIIVGWRRRLQPMVWIVGVAAIVTAIALVRVGEDVAPFALFLVLLAVMIDWVGDARQWWHVRWLPALAADGMVVWLAIQNAPAPDGPQADAAVAVALTLFVGAFASFAARLLRRRQDVSRFEIFQSAAALVVGYGGAAYIARMSGLSTVSYGAAGLVLGACLYVVAFWRYSNLTQSGVHYFSTMAIALVIAGGTLMLQPPLAAALWIVLAPAGMWLGRRDPPPTPSAHGAAYLVAAAAASGLLTLVGYGLLASAGLTWRTVAPVALATLAAAALCSAIAPMGVRTLRSTGVVVAIAGRRAYLGAPRAIALAVFVLGLSGVVVTWVVASLAGRQGDWGLIATIRTATLAAATVFLALLARGDRMREAGWLIYPLLVMAGLKIVLEDLRLSEPGTLFVALILYGSALIVAPKLAAKR